MTISIHSPTLKPKPKQSKGKDPPAIPDIRQQPTAWRCFATRLRNPTKFKYLTSQLYLGPPKTFPCANSEFKISIMTAKKQKDGELNNFEYLSLFMTESVRQYEELVVDQYRLRNRSRFVFLTVAGLALTVFQGINSLPENKIKLILIGVAIAGFIACLILLLKIEWPKVIATDTFTHDE